MEYSVIPKPTHPRQIAPLQRPNLRDLRHIAPLCATYCPYDILPPFWQKGAICRRDNMSGGQYVMEPILSPVNLRQNRPVAANVLEQANLC